MSFRAIRRHLRALLGKEQGTVLKEPGGRLNVCLAYPNTYGVGMSNLAVQGIYGLLNEHPRVLCERVFLPEPQLLREYERSGTPLLSLESQRPVRDFHVLAFSVSFEGDYPHVAQMLALAGIPALASERTGAHPLLALGGTVAMSNPEPLAPFFDLVFVGEAEALLPPFLEAMLAYKDKEQVLLALAKEEGFYVPALYAVSYGPDGLIARRRPLSGAPETIPRVHVNEPAGFSMYHRVLSPLAEFSQMHLVELMRGCPWSCSFCLVAGLYRPLRAKSPEQARAEVLEALRKGRRVGLIGPSLSDYQGIQELLSLGAQEGPRCLSGALSLTSLRAGPRSVALLPLLRRLGQQSVSIAPEAGTERLRQVLNKRLSQEDILRTAQEVFRLGFPNLRCYFMVGCPTETEEDIQGLIELASEMAGMRRRTRLVLSLSTFVPKPHSPLQFHPMCAQEVLKARLKKIRKALEPRGVLVHHDVPKYAYQQGVFSLADRRLGKVLTEMARASPWKEALRAQGLGEELYVLRQRAPEEHLPWEFLGTARGKEELWRIYRKLLQGAP
jgi:radical SAM superfamily enzyme YgiQ (UPF0313 family)